MSAFNDRESGRGGGGGGRRCGRGGGGGHNVKLSRSLSYVLRHKAVEMGVEIRSDGYVALDALLALDRFKDATLSKIEAVVNDNDKQRFNLYRDDEQRYWIRANQGHSISVPDLELRRLRSSDCGAGKEFDCVVHGTDLKSWALIAESGGLKRMSRNHIHLAAGLPGDNNVISGMRSQCQVYVYVDAARAIEAGIDFFVSANGVVLCSGNDSSVLPAEFFSSVTNSKGQSLLSV
jgi:2'-phosphotransferase